MELYIDDFHESHANHGIVVVVCVNYYITKPR